MEKMQQDMMEMIQQMQKKIDGSEVNITNSINNKCDALEENVKHCINSVIFAYIDNLVKHFVSSTNASAPNIEHAGNQTTISVSDNSHNSDDVTENAILGELLVSQQKQNERELNGGGCVPVEKALTTIDNKQQISLLSSTDLSTDTTSGTRSNKPETASVGDKIPCRLKPAEENRPKHDVFIGGLNTETTDDDIRCFMYDIGVTNIVTITRINNNTPTSASFRITINDASIKHNVYNPKLYTKGITAKPFRFYSQGVLKGDKAQSSSTTQSSKVTDRDHHNKRSRFTPTTQHAQHVPNTSTQHTGSNQVKFTAQRTAHKQTSIETPDVLQRESQSRDTSQTVLHSPNQQQMPLNAYAVPFVPPSYNYFQPPQQQMCNSNIPQPSHATYNPQPSHASSNPQPSLAMYNAQPSPASHNPQRLHASSYPQPMHATCNSQPSHVPCNSVVPVVTPNYYPVQFTSHMYPNLN